MALPATQSTPSMYQGYIGIPGAAPGSADYGRTGQQANPLFSGNTSSSTSAAGSLVPGQTGIDKYAQNFYAGLQPNQLGAIQHLMNLLNNPQQMSDEYRNFAMGQVQQHLPELYAHLQSTGQGIGAQQGATLAANNQGADQANAFQSQLNSPSGIQARGSAINQLGAEASPQYQGLAALGRIQNPFAPQQDNSLGQIGGIIGGIAGLAKL